MKPHQGNLLCMLTMFLQTIGDQVVWNLSQDTQGITLRLDLTTDAAATSSSTSQVKNSSSKKHKAPSRRKRDRQRLLNHLAKKRTPADPTNPVGKSQHCGPQHNKDEAAGATSPVVSSINSLNATAPEFVPSILNVSHRTINQVSDPVSAMPCENLCDNTQHNSEGTTDNDELPFPNCDTCDIVDTFDNQSVVKVELESLKSQMSESKAIINRNGQQFMEIINANTELECELEAVKEELFQYKFIQEQEAAITQFVDIKRNSDGHLVVQELVSKATNTEPPTVSSIEFDSELRHGNPSKARGRGRRPWNRSTSNTFRGAGSRDKPPWNYRASSRNQWTNNRQYGIYQVW